MTRWQGRNDGVSLCRRRLQSTWEARLPSHPPPWLSSPQIGPSDDLEAQTSKMDRASIVLSSLPLHQELTKPVDLEEVRFSLVLGTPYLPCDHHDRSGAHTGQLPKY